MARRLGVVIAAYAALTIALLSPGVLHFRTAAIGDAGDSSQMLWNLWWVKRALVELHQSPFHTNLLFHPTGVNLWLHTLTPLNGVVSIPLQSAFGLVPAYNALVVASFI